MATATEILKRIDDLSKSNYFDGVRTPKRGYCEYGRTFCYAFTKDGKVCGYEGKPLMDCQRTYCGIHAEKGRALEAKAKIEKSKQPEVRGRKQYVENLKKDHIKDGAICCKKFGCHRMLKSTCKEDVSDFYGDYCKRHRHSHYDEEQDIEVLIEKQMKNLHYGKN